jgi:hypothetical protein
MKKLKFRIYQLKLKLGVMKCDLYLKILYPLGILIDMKIYRLKSFMDKIIFKLSYYKRMREYQSILAGTDN